MFPGVISRELLSDNVRELRHIHRLRSGRIVIRPAFDVPNNDTAFQFPPAAAGERNHESVVENRSRKRQSFDIVLLKYLTVLYVQSHTGGVRLRGVLKFVFRPYLESHLLNCRGALQKSFWPSTSDGERFFEQPMIETLLRHEPGLAANDRARDSRHRLFCARRSKNAGVIRRAGIE